MRRKKMLDAMELLDEKYLAEAEIKKKSPHRRAWITVAAAAACFGIVLGSFGIYRLANRDTTNIEQYRDSEYYPLIQKLEEYKTLRAMELQEEYTFFDRLFSGFGAKAEDSEGAAGNDSMAPGDPGDGAATGTANGASQRYEEATDNQVEGVIEGDLIKRSDRYIYYLEQSKTLLHVYDIAGDDTQEVGQFAITLAPQETRYLSYRGFPWEMYLSEDCRTLTLIAPYYIGRDDARNRNETAVIALDVSDPSAICEKNRVTVAGDYHSSRVTDGTLYLLNRFYVQSPWEYDKLETFVPQIDCGSGFEALPLSQIVIPEEVTTPSYTVISRIDADSLTFEAGLGCLSYSGELYASRDALYLVRGRAEEEKDGDIVTVRTKSDVLRVSYADDGLTPCGTVSVDGTVKDQYSLDEYEGILRIVTSTSVDRYEKKRKYDNFLENEVNASLFAVDIAGMQIVSSVEHFAPAGETVRSARFDGTKGYVCTAIQQTDPVFFFDLSDVHNITYKDTGTIPGFSTSLIQFGDGLLLGIGEKNSMTKVEIYTETEAGVEAIAEYTPFANHYMEYYSTEYKSYLIDREEKLFGFGHDNGGNKKYVLLKYVDGELKLWWWTNFLGDDYSLNDMRAVYIDGYIYLFADEYFRVADVTEPQA